MRRTLVLQNNIQQQTAGTNVTGRLSYAAKYLVLMMADDQQIIHGEIADYYIEDGILVSLSKSIQRTVENISANVVLVKEITGNKKMPLLIFIAPSPIPDKATQKLSTEKLPEIYKAMAMVSKPGLSAFIMKLLFALKQPPIPMKNFTDAAKAKEWLQQFKD